MFDHEPQCFGETKNGVGRFAFGIGQVRDGEERAINVIVAVDEKQLHLVRAMLDSGCWMLDDQGMAEQWIIRVEGKEYGPAELATLREWKTEGRVLATNEARRVDVDLWSTAGVEIPGCLKWRRRCRQRTENRGQRTRTGSSAENRFARVENLRADVSDLFPGFLSISRTDVAHHRPVDLRAAHRRVGGSDAECRCRSSQAGRRRVRFLYAALGA